MGKFIVGHNALSQEPNTLLCLVDVWVVTNRCISINQYIHLQGVRALWLEENGVLGPKKLKTAGVSKFSQF